MARPATPRHTPTAVRWLALFGVLGLAAVVAYPDGYQQDAGYHFLFARWSWEHPELLVGVWSRPLFTALYAGPALVGYPAAKVFTLVIALAAAHQTWRLAADLGLRSPALVVPLLFVQPSWLMLATETMTEPLFALVFVAALRLHVRGRTAPSQVLASLLVLIRPEGFVLGVLWGVWALVDRRDPRPIRRRLPGTLRLGLGMVLWWLAALAATGDPLFIWHNWPREWAITRQTYGIGPAWIYLARLPEIAGPVFAAVFVLGLTGRLRHREFGWLTSAVLTLFVVHTVLRVFGWLGSAGYARYFVCVSPAIAVLTLTGWHDLTARLAPLGRGRRRIVQAAIWGLSVAVAVLYVDLAGFYGRDAHAVRVMHASFEAEPRPVTRFVWSQAYMAIAFDRDPYENLTSSGDRAAALDALRAAPAGTLVLWDADTGPAWFGVGAEDFEAAGFTRLAVRSFELDGVFRASRWLPFVRPRPQTFTLLYREEPGVRR